MICTNCDGKGFVPASLNGWQAAEPWNGRERRRQDRQLANADLRFREAEPAARYQSCPLCDGGGKLHPNLLSTRAKKKKRRPARAASSPSSSSVPFPSKSSSPSPRGSGLPAYGRT